jgi:hypothetical protein
MHLLSRKSRVSGYDLKTVQTINRLQCKAGNENGDREFPVQCEIASPQGILRVGNLSVPTHHHNKKSGFHKDLSQFTQARKLAFI